MNDNFPTLDSRIEIECKECGHVEIIAKYCPYTGHLMGPSGNYVYGSGFEYKCSECHGAMEEK